MAAQRAPRSLSYDWSAFSAKQCSAGNMIRMARALVAIPGALIVRPAWLLGLYAAMLPFDRALGIGEGFGAVTRYVGIGVIAALWANRLLSPQSHILRPPRVLAASFGLLALALLSMLWSLSPGATAQGLFSLGGLLLIYASMAVYPFSSRDYQNITSLVMLGGILASLWTIAAYASGFTLGHTIRGTLVLSEEGRLVDPNYFAASMILPFSLLLHNLLWNRRLWVALGLLLVSVAILLTGSGGGIIGLLGAVVVGVWRSRARLRRPRAVMTAALVALLAASTVSFLVAEPAALTQRFTPAQWFETGGTGRLHIWHVGWLAFLERPIQGYGLGTFPEAYELHRGPLSELDRYYARAYRSSHSLWMESLVELGVVGFLLVAVAVVSHWRRIIAWSRKVPDAIPIEAALIGTVLACTFLTSLRTHKSLWLVLGLAVVYVNLQRRQGERPNEHEIQT